MKKILTLLAVGALGSSCMSVTSACSRLNTGATDPNLNFDVWNLSSWGNDQKSIISKDYLAIAQKDNNDASQKNSPLSWSDWTQNFDSQGITDEEYALLKGLDKINPDIIINDHFWNVKWFYSPKPSDKTSLKTVLTNGLELYLKGFKQGICGDLSVSIKGEI